jgi:putative transposase
MPPYADVLAWCLMPNHFHLMVLVRELEITHPMTLSHRMSTQTLNQSIAVLLRSYTRAINKEQDLSGSLFRQKTKSECLNCPDAITPSFFSESGSTKINIQNPEKQYPQICFDYIHQNPVKAAIVENETDWEFSSAKDFAGSRKGTLVNKKIAEMFIKIK